MDAVPDRVICCIMLLCQQHVMLGRLSSTAVLPLGRLHPLPTAAPGAWLTCLAPSGVILLLHLHSKLRNTSMGVYLHSKLRNTSMGAFACLGGSHPAQAVATHLLCSHSYKGRGYH